MSRRGFTLVELLVVMAIIATLLTIALPRYFGSVQRAKESTLKQSLAVTREAIDKFYGDRGRYPRDLEELEREKYLRTVPVDPITESSATWVFVSSPSTPGRGGSLYDIKSGSAAKGIDGTPVSTW